MESTSDWRCCIQRNAHTHKIGLNRMNLKGNSMPYLPAIILIGLLMGAALAAEDQVEPHEDREFETHVYENKQGEQLPYRLLKPPDENLVKNGKPLLIFLHGMGERGNDNEKQLVHGRAMMQAAVNKHGAVVLAPQCPVNDTWSGWSDDSNKPTSTAKLLLELLLQIEKQDDIDPDRIYIMGLSMGGYGVWSMIQRHPNKFAAAAPICGGGDSSKAEPIKNVPIWVFHGAEDEAVPVSRSREMIAALKQAGGDPKYTEYPNVGHDSWLPAFKEPDLLKWLFAQQRLSCSGA